MTVSKKVTLAANGETATVAAATIGDIFTTLFSMDSCVTGFYGLTQKLGLVAAGMAGQNYRLGRGINFIKVD